MTKKIPIILVFILTISFLNFVSAGIGLIRTQESALVNEGQKTCLSYGVFNPFEEDSYAIIEVSEVLQDVLIVQDTEAALIPAYTTHDIAIPIEFCFKVPKVYTEDCSVGSFICEQTCEEPQKVYEGEVVVTKVPDPTSIGGSGGSTTKVSVGAPLRIRVQCNAHPRDYTLIYVLAALISVGVIGFVLFSKYRKPKEIRIREKMKKLKEEMKKSRKK